MPDWDPATYCERLASLLAGCLLCASWLFSVHVRSRPGLSRLAAALPVVAFNCGAPLLFRRVASSAGAGTAEDSEIVTIVLVEFALTWLSNFKVPYAMQAAVLFGSLCWSLWSRRPLAGIMVVRLALPRLQVLAWAANRGPLAADQWNMAQFAAIQLAPISPMEGTTSLLVGKRVKCGMLTSRRSAAAPHVLRWLLLQGPRHVRMAAAGGRASTPAARAAWRPLLWPKLP